MCNDMAQIERMHALSTSTDLAVKVVFIGDNHDVSTNDCDHRRDKLSLSLSLYPSIRWHLMGLHTNVAWMIVVLVAILLGWGLFGVITNLWVDLWHPKNKFE